MPLHIKNARAAQAIIGSAVKSFPWPGSKTKYRAEGHYDADGIFWASKREENFWHTLKLRERLGEITDLRRQVRFPLNVTSASSKELFWIQVAVLVIDFAFMEDGKLRVLDAKGFATPVYKLKKKMFEAEYGLRIEEV